MTCIIKVFNMSDHSVAVFDNVSKAVLESVTDMTSTHDAISRAVSLCGDKYPAMNSALSTADAETAMAIRAMAVLLASNPHVLSTVKQTFAVSDTNSNYLKCVCNVLAGNHGQALMSELHRLKVDPTVVRTSLTGFTNWNEVFATISTWYEPCGISHEMTRKAFEKMIPFFDVEIGGTHALPTLIAGRCAGKWLVSETLIVNRPELDWSSCGDVFQFLHGLLDKQPGSESTCNRIVFHMYHYIRDTKVTLTAEQCKTINDIFSVVQRVCGLSKKYRPNGSLLSPLTEQLIYIAEQMMHIGETIQFDVWVHIMKHLVQLGRHFDASHASIFAKLSGMYNDCDRNYYIAFSLLDVNARDNLHLREQMTNFIMTHDFDESQSSALLKYMIERVMANSDSMSYISPLFNKIKTKLSNDVYIKLYVDEMKKVLNASPLDSRAFTSHWTRVQFVMSWNIPAADKHDFLQCIVDKFTQYATRYSHVADFLAKVQTIEVPSLDDGMVETSKVDEVTSG